MATTWTLPSWIIYVAVSWPCTAKVIINSEGHVAYCDTEVFQAKCADDEVIFMQTALYGRMRIGKCVDKNFGYVGCGKDVLHLADWMCSGRTRCQIPVPNTYLKGEAVCPKDLTPYFEAHYVCIKVQTAPEQTCQSSSFILPGSTRGFLSNHLTMETKKGSADCPWMIQGHPGQRINFTIYDFSRKDLRDQRPLTVGANGICRVYAVVRENGQSGSSTSICSGATRITHGYTSTSHAVEVRILGKRDADNPEYFLMKYEIIGCADPEIPEHGWMEREGDVVTIGCHNTGQKWRLICDVNSWSGNFGNCSNGSRQATFGEIVWGNLFMSFEVSLTIVVGIAVGIGIVILACGVICIRSTCPPKKKQQQQQQRKQRKRPVNTVPPQRVHQKRLNGNLQGPPPPPPNHPASGLITESSHGPLPPPPPFLMDEKSASVTENEYAYISEMPPPPPSPTPPDTVTPPFPDPPAGVVIANPGAEQMSDSEPDYTSPPTPYSSPRHTTYEQSSREDIESEAAAYFYRNRYSTEGYHSDTGGYPGRASQTDSNFSMKIYVEQTHDELPPYYETDPEDHVPYRFDYPQSPPPYSQNPMPPTNQVVPMFTQNSLQSRYWRNKQMAPPLYNGRFDSDNASLHSKTGTM